MNYLSSFLNWSNEPTETNTIEARPAYRQHKEYVSPLSTLQKLDGLDANASQSSSLTSALFSGWGSSSNKQKSQPYLNNVSSTNFYHQSPYSSHRTLELPSITSQHQNSVVLVPTSNINPSAGAVSVTASPPPPMHMMRDNDYHNIYQATTTHIHKKRSSSLKNQIKFTPKYKKRLSQTKDKDESHCVSQHLADDADDVQFYGSLDAIAESRTTTPINRAVYKTSSALIDALQLDVDNELQMKSNDVDTPPPRAPLEPFRAITATTDDYPSIPFQYQSVTESVDLNEAMADAPNTEEQKITSNLMVSLLTEYGANYDDGSIRSPRAQDATISLQEATHISNNHLLPLQQNIILPHLADGDEDNETTEVNLHYNNETPVPMMVDNDMDTNSVVSDFEEAGIWLSQTGTETKETTRKKQNKIRVTCNNCYLWRHHTNKLEIDSKHLRTRIDELEENINDAEDNVQFSQQHYGELKQENKRLRDKNKDLKQDISQQTQQANDALISVRKKQETETQEIHKQYQHLMKQKNELELSYNKQVNICNDKEAEIEKYKNELHAMQLKHDRLHESIKQERIALNLREKEMKHNLDEITEKYLNLQKEFKHTKDELQSKINEGDECINSISDENSSYKLRVSELNDECQRMKAEIESIKVHENKLLQEKDEMEHKLKENDMKARKLQKEKEHIMNPSNELELKNDELMLQSEALSADLKSAKEKNEMLMNQVTEFKEKYNEMNRTLVESENVYHSLHEKHQRLIVDMSKYKEKNDSLSVKLQTSENECIELNTKLSDCMQENETKLSEIRESVHDLEDELTATKDENARLLKIRQTSGKQWREREEQHKQSNQENDQLMDQNYELKEKLNKTIEELDECQHSLYAMKHEENEYNEKLEVLSGKLDAAVAERDKQLKKSVRSNNQVKSLQNENKALTDSIHHLESIIDDTYGLAEDKARKLSHLKRKNNKNQLDIDSLKKRMKKHERQQTSYRQIEVDKISKSHRKMDQKLNNLRKSNVNLQNENDELHTNIKALKRDINEFKSELTETKTKFKSRVSKYESDVSQMTANNNKILSDQINLEAELESTKEENIKIIQRMNVVQRKYDEMESMQHIHIRVNSNDAYDDTYNTFIKMDLCSDDIYQFANRCRNIFINTNRLTPKLIMQLIESCHRSIIIFHETKARFAHFIHKCDGIHMRLNNLQQSIKAKYTKTGTLIPRAPATPSPQPISRSTKGTSEGASSSYSNLKQMSDFPNTNQKKMNKRQNSNQFKKKSTNKIRRPIQEKKPAHLEAYNEIYLISLQNIANAKHDMDGINKMYKEPIDYVCYHCDDDEEEDDDDIACIDWDKLAIHPSEERYEMQEMMKNNERFAAIINKIKTSTKELRTLHAKSKIELNLAYYLAPLDYENRNSERNEDDVEFDYDIDADLQMNSEYFELMKKVNQTGLQKKRFSII